MLIINYDKRKVLLCLVPFQIIPLVLARVSYGLGTGDTHTSFPKGLPIVLLLIFLLYLFFSYIMIAMIRNPLLVRIADDGELLWNTSFGERRVTLPKGAVVQHGNQRVFIMPPVNGVPYARTRADGTQLTLPSGLREIPSGEFTIR